MPYNCEMVGCPWSSERHYRYINHFKKYHPALRNIRCGYLSKCHRRFSSVYELEQHAPEHHTSRTVVNNTVTAGEIEEALN